MEIVFFNSYASIVQIGREVSNLSGHLLMADALYFDSIVSTAMIQYQDIDESSDELIVGMFETINENDAAALALAANIKRDYPRYKKGLNFKHKDKSELLNIGKMKRILKNVRAEVKEHFGELMQKHNLLSMLHFSENDVLFLQSNDLNNVENKENDLVTYIAINIINQDITFSLTDHIETNFLFQTLYSSGSEDYDFLKINLWKFPFMVEISYEHLNYTRGQLLPVFQPFKEKLKELQTEFFTLEFIPENLPHFKQSIIEKINPLILPVQQAIDESIYLSKLKNNYPPNYGLTFCIGIGPAETIVDYYQKNQIIEPYEATEIKERISRHISLKSTYIFTYFEVHNYTSESIKSIQNDI